MWDAIAIFIIVVKHCLIISIYNNVYCIYIKSKIELIVQGPSFVIVWMTLPKTAALYVYIHKYSFSI